ncbi:MAG: helix-turn-helix domain-containing protein [Candidatus Aenigmatarchaeota archaeon]
MVVATTEALDALKSIGLNLYERKIFVALLAKGIATAAEVSEIAGVPRSRSYDVLESLSGKGFVVVQPSKPIKYVALHPKEALERTKENLRKNHDVMIDRIDKLQDSPILIELESIHKSTLSLVKTSDMSGTVKGRFMINRQLNSMLRGAKNEITIATTTDGLENLHNEQLKQLKKLSKRGVKVRILAPGKDKIIVGALSKVAEVRTLDKPIGRIVVVDNECMLMSLTDDDVHETQDVAFWSNSPHAAKNTINNLFNQAWKVSK